MKTEIDDDEIILYVEKTFNPDQVFDEDDLELWAKKNGFVKVEEARE